MLKQLTKKKRTTKQQPAIESSSKKGSTESIIGKITNNLPSFSTLPNKNTMVDLCLFGATFYVIYYHGKDIAKYFESMCPTEQGILDMMKREQAGMGMPPPM